MYAKVGPLVMLLMTCTLTAGAEEHVASVGEGARDLATRLYLHRSSWPTVSVEMHGDVGDAVPLLGPATFHYRLKPMFMLGATPLPSWTVFAGGGFGAAYVMHGMCSDRVATGLCSGTTESMAATTMTAQMGARMQHDTPLVLTFEVDTASGHGTMATLNLALEIGGLSPQI